MTYIHCLIKQWIIIVYRNFSNWNSYSRYRTNSRYGNNIVPRAPSLSMSLFPNGFIHMILYFMMRKKISVIIRTSQVWTRKKESRYDRVFLGVNMASSTNSHEKFRMGPNWFVLASLQLYRGKRAEKLKVLLILASFHHHLLTRPYHQQSQIQGEYIHTLPKNSMHAHEARLINWTVCELRLKVTSLHRVSMNR